MYVLLIIVPLIFIIIISVILYPILKPSDEVITEESITSESSSITSESSSITSEIPTTPKLTTPKPTISPIPSIDCVLSQWSACDSTGKQIRNVIIPTSGTGLACGDIIQDCTQTPTPKPTISPIPSIDCVLSQWSACDSTGKQIRNVIIPTSGTGLACGDIIQDCTQTPIPMPMPITKKNHL